MGRQNRKAVNLKPEGRSKMTCATWRMLSRSPSPQAPLQRLAPSPATWLLRPGAPALHTRQARSPHGRKQPLLLLPSAYTTTAADAKRLAGAVRLNIGDARPRRTPERVRRLAMGLGLGKFLLRRGVVAETMQREEEGGAAGAVGGERRGPGRGRREAAHGWGSGGDATIRVQGRV
ncbi:unnamed protein product [Miscanthus lutarioriparius]|uniref:Uncharacterized protein n=1 Tax=Miscanthus lutarioriparius TaxID=422564 RepID=A0A811MYN7_9POAL|nr:unnamed protein product [Miscanthus lutarioriparius]